MTGNPQAIAAAMCATLDALPEAPPEPPRPTIAAELESGGFLQSVAGEDFPRVVAAAEALESGRVRALLFTGCAGCGKTLAARIIAKRVFRSIAEGCPHLEPRFIRAHAVGALDETALYCFRLARCGDVLLDDAGTDRPSVVFGTDTDPVAEYLENFCDSPSSHARCILTTNLDSDGMLRRYGSRVLSRIEGTFGVLRFRGGDHRIANRIVF